MQRRDALRLLAGIPAAALAGGWSVPATAQVTRGFDQRLRAIASGEEIQRQPDLWIFEISFKQMRMTWADVRNPRTGETARDQIWYLAYRTINRTLTARQDEGNTTPQNELDPLPGPTPFIPEFTLSVLDQPDDEVPEQVVMDEVIPEAVARINQIERRRASEPLFRNSVDIVQPLPEPVAEDAENPEWLYGVATWRNVDPETDFFTVSMRGFSNGYEIRQGPDGQPLVWRKSIVQKFTRRGDRFDPTLAEFEFDGPPRWTYLPDPGSPAATTPAAT
jgi:hypothetical protein